MDTYLCDVDFSVVHEVENILELFLVDALQIEERVLVCVVGQDAPEKWRARSLKKMIFKIVLKTFH